MSKNIILCIDDESTILSSLKTELKGIFPKDYLIEVAESGDDALELVNELLEDNHHISLVISDYLNIFTLNRLRPSKLC
jgi:CheY-like chemotaxis protein